MIMRIVAAVAVAFLAGLLCLLAGVVLPLLGAPIAVVVGQWLTQWAWPIGVAVGILYFVQGGGFPAHWFHRSPPP